MVGDTAPPTLPTLMVCRADRLEGLVVTEPLAFTGQPCRNRPAAFSRLPFWSTMNEPARVNSRGSVIDGLALVVVTKKPWPWMLRSVVDWVWTGLPWTVTCCWACASTPPAL